MAGVDEKNHKTAIAPMLSVRNGAKAIEFYKAALGAGELFRVDNDKGEVVAQLSVERLNFESLGGGSVRMVMIVADPDAVVACAVGAGAKLVWPVDQRHGWLIGRVVDPFGHHWEIGKPLNTS